MSRLRCLKHVALAVSVSPVHQDHRRSTTGLAVLVFFRGESTVLSLSQSFCVFRISLKMFPKSCKRLQTCANSRLRTAPIGKNKDPLRTSDALPVSLD